MTAASSSHQAQTVQIDRCLKRLKIVCLCGFCVWCMYILTYVFSVIELHWLASECQGSICFHGPTTGVKTCATTSNYRLGTGDPNSGPHPCTVKNLLMEPSGPRTQFNVF